ncbi:MAG: undecaprenyl-phosphate glucose phosphotransferase [Bacteroidia bacterium]|nr:undecaprenyl-phosphate glucose phosphotransferase [Bacteroidia bacterium]
MKVKKQRIIFGYVLLELVLLNFALFAVVFFKSFFIPQRRYDAFLEDGYLLLSVIYNVSWLLILLLNGTQDMYIRQSLGARVRELLTNSFILLGMSSTLILLVNLEEYPITILLGPVGLFAALNLIAFIIVHRVVGKSSERINFGAKLLVIGAGQSGKEVLTFTERNRHLGYDVIGFLDDYYPSSNGINLLGRLHDLPSVLDTKPVDEIVIALPFENNEENIRQAIEVADFRGVRVNIVPDYPEMIKDRYQAYNIGSMPVLQLKQTPLDQFHNFMTKKIFDFVFALVMLILLSPILLVIAILIKLDSRGPVFYKPLRKGQMGRVFKCFKFRSMYVDTSANAGTKSTQKNDPRITRLGAFLRKTNIDELPQLINVLIGNMSVVGPRPHRVNLNDELQQLVDKYMVRHYVKPGITGWAQVNGFRGPTETPEAINGRVKHDLYYIENWSFWFDIKIIFLTVFGKKVRQNAF